MIDVIEVLGADHLTSAEIKARLPDHSPHTVSNNISGALRKQWLGRDGIYDKTGPPTYYVRDGVVSEPEDSGKATPPPDALVWDAGILPHIPRSKEEAMTAREIAEAAGLEAWPDTHPAYSSLGKIRRMPHLGTLHQVHSDGKHAGCKSKWTRWWFESKRAQ